MRLGSCFAFAHGELRDFRMPIRRFDRILTGTAIALVLGLAATASPALAQDQKAIEALVPMPEPANMPPPRTPDSGGPAETPGSTPSAGVARPDPPDLPPPTFKDVATPAAPPAPEAAPATAAAPAAAPAPAPPAGGHPDHPTAG